MVENNRQFRFKIIAGEFKGRIITAPDLGLTRPPLTRLRKAIFDFLSPYLAGSAYLDLYSGTGSYLFEATSRGASTALGVEIEEQLARGINDQADRLGLSDRLRCLCGDVDKELELLSQSEKTYDIVMSAPPQYQGMINRTIRQMKDNALLTTDGLLICQHATSETRSLQPLGFEISQQRRYGNTTFSILQKR